MKYNYFYIDEGGMFGNCIICITNKPLPKDHIMHEYYFGKLRIGKIIRHIQLFNQVYPNIIRYNKDSDLMNIPLEQRGM